MSYDVMSGPITIGSIFYSDGPLCEGVYAVVAFMTATTAPKNPGWYISLVNGGVKGPYDTKADATAAVNRLGYTIEPH